MIPSRKFQCISLHNKLSKLHVNQGRILHPFFRECFVAKVRMMNSLNQVRSMTDVFKSAKLEVDSHEFKIQSDHISAAFSSFGLLKAVTLPDSGNTYPLHLDFAK